LKSWSGQTILTELNQALFNCILNALAFQTASKVSAGFLLKLIENVLKDNSRDKCGQLYNSLKPTLSLKSLSLSSLSSNRFVTPSSYKIWARASAFWAPAKGREKNLF